MNKKIAPFSSLLGHYLLDVYVNNNQTKLIFVSYDGEKTHQWEMSHQQDCCESGYLQDVVGDFEDLMGNNPVIVAEVTTNKKYRDKNRKYKKDEEIIQTEEGLTPEGTWTFYRLATIDGTVTLRWQFVSNGYYSEEVSFYKVALEE